MLVGWDSKTKKRNPTNYIEKLHTNKRSNVFTFCLNTLSTSSECLETDVPSILKHMLVFPLAVFLG